MSLKSMKQLLNKKVVTGVSVDHVSYSISKPRTHDSLLEFFGGNSVLGNNMTSGSGLTKYVGVTNSSRSIFLGFCKTLNTFVLRFSGEDGPKDLKNFSENFLFVPNNEEIVQDIRRTSVDATVVAMPSAYSSAEDYINAIEKLVSVQQKSIPKLEVKQGTLYIGGKTGSNSIRISALKSQTGVLESLVLNIKAKGLVAEKIGNLFLSNPQCNFEDILAYHILNTLNSISSTTFLEVFKDLLVKSYAVGSVLLQQNTEKQVFSSTGTYVARSLKGVSNKLYNEAHSAEVQDLLANWLLSVVINKKFIKKGDAFVNSLKSIFDGTTPVPVAGDVPVEPKGSGRRTRKGVASKSVDAS